MDLNATVQTHPVNMMACSLFWMKTGTSVDEHCYVQPQKCQASTLPLPDYHTLFMKNDSH